MKVEFYEQRRQQLIQQVRIERQRILNEEAAGLWAPQTDYIENNSTIPDVKS